MQSSVPGGIRPAYASKTFVSTPPLSDIASVDSAYPTNTGPNSANVLDFSGSNCGTTLTRGIETFLKFDISSIPPQATIVTATLSGSLFYARVSTTVGVYYESNSTWSQATLNWNNRPGTVSGSTLYSSVSVSNSTSSYRWDVTRVLVTYNPTQPKITFILFPTSSQSANCNGWIDFASSSISLSVTYSYASTSVSLSSNSMQYGNSVTITGSTDPPQSGGTMTLEYSTNQATWNALQVQGGGASTYAWTPPSAGTYYVESVWSVSWGSGSYSTSSQPVQFSVTQAPSMVQLSLSPNTITVGKSVTLTVTFVSPSSVSDGVITILYSIDGNNWNVLIAAGPSSGSWGNYVYVWTPPSVATYYFRAYWSGDSNYLNSPYALQTLTVTHEPTSIRMSAPSSSRLDQQITVTATLLDSSNSPIAGAQLSFQLDSTSLGTRATDASGMASLTFTLSVRAGTHTITVTYAGSNQYQASSQQSTFQIIPWQLVISSSVPNAPLVAFNGQNYSADSTGKVVIQIPLSGAYTVSVNTPLTFALGSRYAFVQWGGGSTALTRSINIAADTSLLLIMKPQYFISIQSGGGTTTGGGIWYDGGATVTIIATSPSAVVQNVSRLVFVGWTGLPSSNKTIQFVAGQPYNITANWIQQYYVTASNTMGNIEGIGWYNKSSSATIKISPTVFGFLIQQVFNGWAESVPENGGVSTFVVSGPVDLHATWRTDYTQLIVLVAAVVGGGGGAGGFYFVRRRKRPGPEHETIAKTEPQPTEPTGQTVVERQPRPEVGTSVYTGSACPVCGVVNPVGAVYCGSCGADLQRQ